MCSHRQISGSLAALIALVATAQTPYPELTIQDVAWNSGTHHYAVSHRILSPGTSTLPANISGTADAEFVSATSVRLAPGFHAGGFSTDGRFRARIGEGLGQMGDVVIIPEEPYSYMADNIAHVHKWEKLEVGLRLPQQYQNAVDAFFEHYYSNGVTQLSTPGMVDPIHHLNPYADDSLQLVMLLTDPDGQPRMKWGYFMREAKWESEDEIAPLVEDTDHPLHPYHIRFRFAPDKEGPWSFTLSLQAPHTQQGGALLPAQFHSGFNFHCDPPEPDNKGHLRVHDVNHRILQFEDDTPFIGLGVNMADRHRPWAGLGWGDYYAKRDHDQMVESMAMLQDVGGNFLRMYLLEKNFSPEFVNLGVYDSYKAPATCNNGTGGGFAGSCQNQSWAFDELLDEARRNNLYIQLCVDPYPPGIAYEKHGWGANPYLLNFMKPRDANNRYDMKKFFFTDGDTTATASGPFYFWKRKYKYLMSRWGYSVNIAALEPFNEIDQMLTYRQQTVIDVAQCTESMGSWNKDDDLPHVVDKWFTKIADHVRRPIDLGNPLTSPLGEAKKLFLASYTGSHDAVDPGTQDPNIDHYRPFDNSRVDLMSVHRYFSVADDDEMGMPDRFLNGAEWQVGEFRRTYPLDPGTARKPFTHGEMNYSSERTVGSWRAELEKIFHNYDVSFHNEIWSSAFSGKFTTGTTWHWERVFWWEDALRVPPPDDDNEQQVVPFSNTLDAINFLDLGLNPDHAVENLKGGLRTST